MQSTRRIEVLTVLVMLATFCSWVVDGFIVNPSFTSRVCPSLPSATAHFESTEASHKDNEFVAKRIIVKGDVQGGYYRACVLNEARRFRRLVGTMSPPDDTDIAEIYVEVSLCSTSSCLSRYRKTFGVNCIHWLLETCFADTWIGKSQDGWGICAMVQERERRVEPSRWRRRSSRRRANRALRWLLLQNQVIVSCCWVLAALNLESIGIESSRLDTQCLIVDGESASCELGFHMNSSIKLCLCCVSHAD